MDRQSGNTDSFWVGEFERVTSSQRTSAKILITRAPTMPNACCFCSPADFEVVAGELEDEVLEDVEDVELEWEPDAAVVVAFDVPLDEPLPVVTLLGAVAVPVADTRVQRYQLKNVVKKAKSTNENRIVSSGE